MSRQQLRKEAQRFFLRVWAVSVWLLIPYLPRSFGMVMLHRYLRAAIAWRTRWVPA